MKKNKIIYNNISFFLFLIIIQNDFYFSQINDGFSIATLEESELLEVNDYHNFNLIVTTLKNIYIGIPPSLKVTTNAELINASSLITLNENYLLAACLQDSLLTKININNGDFSSLLGYSDLDSSLELEIPVTSCSLSILDNTIFVGYSKIIYYNEDDSDATKTNKTNIVIKLNIKNKNSESGPDIDIAIPKKFFIFPEPTIKTDSNRQILCEPLRVINDLTDYRLVCLYENYEDAEDDVGNNRYYIHATSINKNFDGFEINSREMRIFRVDEESGFKIIKNNDTFATCVMKKRAYIIYLEKGTDNIVKIFKNNDIYSNINNKFDALFDLFDYNNNILIFSSKEKFMNINNVYYIRINKESTSDYFILYDYYEGDLKQLLCYHNIINDNILVVYQYTNLIKYFCLLNSNIIYSLDNFSKTLQIISNQQIEYNINELFDSSSFGNLNILEIQMNTTEKSTTEKYGKKFYNFKITDNKLNHQDLTNNTWYKYSLSFIEHDDNNYSRFYSPKMDIIIKTCSYLCGRCMEDFYKCDECKNENYILLNNDNYDNICYPINQLLKNHIYDEETNSFEDCYQSCDFCSEKSEDSSNHKCESCAEGYLPSYIYEGNCYKINTLQLYEDKKINNINDESFISSSCTKYKIYSTGECVEECPTTSNYYSFKYNNINFLEITEDITIQQYERTILSPPKYLFNKKCYDLCPSNSIPDDINNICKCEFAFIVDNSGEFICYPDNNCISNYPYQNPNTYECYSSLNHCFTKGNNYFFNKYCYNNQCPENTISLSSKSDKIKNYYKNNLLLDNNLLNKLCICDTTIGVWSNITSNEAYFQECLNKCPQGYLPETITNQCIKISTIKYPDEYYQNSENCLVLYENKCYLNCPKGTCLSQDDPSLMNCINAEPNTKIFNDICFPNFDELTKNIKSMSENNNIISTESGIIIRGYSSNTEDENIDNNANYSVVYLGTCENKIREHYHLGEDTELFILGIDSPNKNKNYITSVYNFGVFLENGTQLDHSSICKDEKISISAAITNPELIKLNEAHYFNGMGYDIFNESSDFYTDNCAPASIDGNDITLADRKKDFYPSNISLCNESCYYSQVNLESKRFTCECDINFNFTDKNFKEREEKEKEDDSSYLDYFLSLINYKIIVCYDLFFDFKSYYYNAGFYIGLATFVFCLGAMFIFIICGMNYLNKIIMNNAPNKNKLLKETKKQLKKMKKLKKNEIQNNNPPKNKNIKKKKKKKNNKKKNSKNINNNKNSEENINKYNKNKDNLNFKEKKYINSDIKNSISTITYFKKDKYKNGKKLKNINKINQNRIKKINNKNKNKNIINEKDKLKVNFSYDNSNDDKIDKKEFNGIPYTQALRIDNRNYFEMFLSVLAHEIAIIDIFYYRDTNKHLSLIFSIYIFELCLDLTLNCLLYTDDVVSEKYNNNGSIKFFTSLSLSFMSNIFASIIALIVGKLAEYSDTFELMMKVMDRKQYFFIIKKFRKYLTLKLTGFYILQIVINIGMCYYLMIFCTVYHKSQGSIMVNYITGIAESMAISFGLTVITSLIRFLSLKYKWKNIYNTSKYLFDHF